MTTPTVEDLDRASIALIFALRDSLSDASPSYPEFWNGRAVSAITAAADGSERAAQALTRAAQKLQVDRIATPQIEPALKALAVIDADYPAWVRHWREGSVYLATVAFAERDQHKRGSAPAPQPTTQPAETQEVPF